MAGPRRLTRFDHPTTMNYEQAVDWLRAQPQHRELVRLCYLDDDTLAAANRFSESEEFGEVSGLLGLKDGSPLKIVDIGCGNGIAAYAMARLGHKVWAVDPDPSDKVGLGGCKRLSGQLSKGEIIPTPGTAESIPLADGSVDVIYTRQSMHHFWNLDAGVKECARVLRKGGLFLGTREHVVSDDAEKVIFLRDHIMQPLHGGENAFRLDEYLGAFSKAGFTVQKAMGRFDSPINFYPGTHELWLRELVVHALVRRGLVAAAAVKQFDYFRRKVAGILSARDRHPGRLYSFLAAKG